MLLVWITREDAKGSGVFDIVEMSGIYDPRRDPEIGADGKHHPIYACTSRVERHLEEFLRKRNYIIDASSRRRVFCAPMPLDEVSTGERCFSNVKQFLNCITEFMIANGRVPTKETMAELPNLSRWANPYAERIEMTGIHAWSLMAAFGYKARIVVESLIDNYGCDVMADGKRPRMRLWDLVGPAIPGKVCDDQFLLEAEAEK